MASGEITLLLHHASHGDAPACAQLYRLVEQQLRQLADKVLARQPGLDLSPTMLINDIFLKLVGPDKGSWHPGDRKKFFGFAAKKMHELAIEARRAQQARKRGGGVRRIAADSLLEDRRSSRIQDVQFLLDLEQVLERLEAISRNDALAFRLKFFLNCTFEELADLLEISETEANRSFARAKRWLQIELQLTRPRSERRAAGKLAAEEPE